MITELIEALTEVERRSLHQRIESQPTQLHQFIAELLRDPHQTSKDLQKRLKLAPNTVFKNLSLAREVIYEIIKQNLSNPYDDLLLPNVLYKRGLGTHASKVRLKLEQQYEEQGWWNVLQDLYGMEMIVAYAACDPDWIESVRDKAAANIERVRALSLVGNDIIALMARVEKGDVKEREVPALHKQLRAALQRAKKIDHPVPIFNALHSMFVLSTRYAIDIAKAKTIIDEIHAMVRHYDARVIPYAQQVAWLNTMGFYAEFDVGITPDEFLSKIESGITNRSLLYDAQALMSMCSTAFLQNDSKRFQDYYTRFEALPHEQSFGYKHAYLGCMKAYMQHDNLAFQAARTAFYTQPVNRAYTDFDLVIRYLEILMLMRAEEWSLTEDKLSATRKFVSRNFSESRVNAEKHNLALLSAVVNRRLKVPVGNDVFRLSAFLRSECAALRG